MINQHCLSETKIQYCSLKGQKRILTAILVKVLIVIDLLIAICSTVYVMFIPMPAAVYSVKEPFFFISTAGGQREIYAVCQWLCLLEQ